MSQIVPAPQADQLLHTFTDKQDSLAAAFAFFNETSEQLTRSYHLLEEKVQQLTCELNQVSEEKNQAQNSRELLASRMQVLLDVLPAGVIVLDNRGNIVEANPAAQRLLETPLTGRLWREVIGECFSPRNDDGLEVSTKAGRRISIATSSLDSGQAGGQLVLLNDLTETRKLQQHLSHTERLSAMGKMVSALAHQVRTPLSAAMLYAEHLSHPDLQEERRQEFTQKLYGRLQHMEHQVRDMLLFVKSELPLNDLISAADLLEGLQEAAEVPLATSSSVCNWQLDCSDIRIKCHRDALISALMNLINNAIQAVGEKAHLQLALRTGKNLKDPGESMLTIELVDNGPGIPEEFMHKAKELFITTKAHGTGLGLAVVQSIARAHGGLFELYSECGEGTTALLQIPIYRHERR